MFGIGTVARLGHVSVRTLRYYDEFGLLHPVWVDPGSGYRWYDAEQLHRLHRILVLRDLGVRLAEIRQLLDEGLSVEELRGILLLRRAEAHDRLAAETARLARVEARLHQLEEPTMSDYDVIVKAVDPEWVIAMSEDLKGLDDIEPAHRRLWPRLHTALEELGAKRVPPSIAIERGSGPIHFTAALPISDDIHSQRKDVETFELGALPRVAATVMRGEPDFDGGFRALRAWAEEAGEDEAGELREVYLDCEGPRDTWVVELQLALRAPFEPSVSRPS